MNDEVLQPLPNTPGLNCLPTSSFHPSMSPILPHSSQSRPNVRLLSLREKLAITSVAAKFIPSVVACSYKLSCFIFVATTACEKCGEGKLMQCEFSFGIEDLNHCEIGRWCLCLNAVILKDSRVFVALKGLGSHTLVSLVWVLAIVRWWVITEASETNCLERSRVVLADKSSGLRLLMLSENLIHYPEFMGLIGDGGRPPKSLFRCW